MSKPPNDLEEFGLVERRHQLSFDTDTVAAVESSNVQRRVMCTCGKRMLSRFKISCVAGDMVHHRNRSCEPRIVHSSSGLCSCEARILRANEEFMITISANVKLKHTRNECGQCL